MCIDQSVLIKTADGNIYYKFLILSISSAI